MIEEFHEFGFMREGAQSVDGFVDLHELRDFEVCFGAREDVERVANCDVVKDEGFPEKREVGRM